VAKRGAAPDPPYRPHPPPFGTLVPALADVTRDFGGSTVYFVIRKANLAKRDFSRLHAIYQQT
jgi:hypothetical protein